MTTDAGAGGGASRGGLSLTREVRIAASPERVFAFFTDPEHMLRWKGIAADLDPREGGRYRVDMNGNDTAVGEYLTVEPFSRIVISWGWEGEGALLPPGSTTVEVTLEPDGSETILRLVHRDLPTDEAAQQHGQGWDHYLERLMIAAGGGDPGPDPWAAETAQMADS